MEVKVGIDTNIFIKLFESAESLQDLKETKCAVYTHPKCLWEMVKYIKTLELKDKNTERVVSDFMRRNGINLTNQEIEEKEIKDFEQQCKKEGINCHSPDSEIILAFKKQGVEKVCSQDKNLRRAAEFIGIKSLRLELSWHMGQNS